MRGAFAGLRTARQGSFSVQGSATLTVEPLDGLNSRRVNALTSRVCGGLAGRRPPLFAVLNHRA